MNLEQPVSPDPNAVFRRQLYALIIVVSAGIMLGRIVAVDNVFDQSLAKIRVAQIPARLQEKKNDLEKHGFSKERIEKELGVARAKLLKEAEEIRRPFLSANDRSRWCTVRALVEPEMRVKDAEGNTVWFAIDKVQTLRGWDTIDMVKHPLPPSNPDALAYLFSSKPPLLPLLFSTPYFVMYNVSGGKISFETDPYFVVRTMLVVLNLLPVVFCWFLMSRLIERFGTGDWCRIFTLAFTCFGTFTSTFIITLNNHIPGICCVCISMYAASRILFDGRRELRYFLIAGLFASFGICCELPMLSYAVFLPLALAVVSPRGTLWGYVPMFLLVCVAFFVSNYAVHQTWSPAYANKEWYQYDYERGGRTRTSHWSNRVGVDVGEESRLAYFYQTTLGHHGIFSLTPVWVLSVAGLFYWMFQRKDPRLRYTALFILSLTLICYVFYMLRPQVDRNYGGLTCAFRWMFWFIPLWTLPLLPVVDGLSKSRLGRGLCLLLLLCSIMSVAYPTWNPWDHPWYYYLMKHLGFQVLG